MRNRKFEEVDAWDRMYMKLLSITYNIFRVGEIVLDRICDVHSPVENIEENNFFYTAAIYIYEGGGYCVVFKWRDIVASLIIILVVSHQET